MKNMWYVKKLNILFLGGKDLSLTLKSMLRDCSCFLLRDHLVVIKESCCVKDQTSVTHMQGKSLNLCTFCLWPPNLIYLPKII